MKRNTTQLVLSQRPSATTCTTSRTFALRAATPYPGESSDGGNQQQLRARAVFGYRAVLWCTYYSNAALLTVGLKTGRHVPFLMHWHARPLAPFPRRKSAGYCS